MTATGTITGIEIDEADGAETRFSFTGEQPNAKIPESAVSFRAAGGCANCGRVASRLTLNCSIKKRLRYIGGGGGCDILSFLPIQVV